MTGRATPDRASTGVELIAAERQRQIETEGWTLGHDDTHTHGELAIAAACYALPADGDLSEIIDFGSTSKIDGMTIAPLWPWHRDWYKRTPRERARELTKAGALIAAEIDRLGRIPRV